MSGLDIVRTIERFLADIDPDALKLVAVLRLMMAQHDVDLIGALALLDDTDWDDALKALLAITAVFERGVRRDAKLLPGKIVDPVGDPFGQGTVIIDTRNAVLLEETDVAMVDNPSDGRRIAALVLAGRINQTADRAEVLYLLNGAAGAHVASALVGLSQREAGEWEAEFRAAYLQLAADLPEPPP